MKNTSPSLPLSLSPFLTLLLLTFTFLAPAAAAPPDAEKAERGPFALTNARIVTVTNGVIEGGTLVIEEGRITALGTDVAIPDDAEVIDCTGLSVYPGMIDSGTQLGLVEVGSLPGTRDYNEIGGLVPHMNALTAVNPNSVAIPVTRVNGVTTVITAPSGGLMPGAAALINLFGYTPEQMLVEDVQMMKLRFPETTRGGWWDDRSQEEIEEEAEEAMDRLNELWDRAALYARIDSAYAAGAAEEESRRPEYVPEMKALLPVVRGEMPLLLVANKAADIQAALDWVEERGLTDNVILSGVAEGWRVADEIVEAGVPCLVGPVIALPARPSDRYDKAYANPGLMHEAGVTVAIRSGQAENVRNLPYHAGFAVAYGMPREAALRAVTIVPARIFGVAGELGSLEVGKQATLFAATGDPFETKTQIRHLFIEGYKVPLESRQTRLYDEFLDRTPGLVMYPEAPASAPQGADQEATSTN